MAQSQDDYGHLLAHASGDVSRRWRLREWHVRQEHDPIWLGVQVLDTYEELAGGGGAVMTDRPIDDGSPEWGMPDFDGPAHQRPMATWVPRGKGSLPTCRHWREPVDLRDGLTVFASAWFDRPYRRRVDMDWPEVGFYLDGLWASAALVSSPGFRPPFVGRRRSQIVIYPWPDLGLPRDPRRFKRALRWILEQAATGRRVEIGCAGGHGRTGTTVAGLLILQGLSPRGALRRVRRSYCDEAVESTEQAEMLQWATRAKPFVRVSSIWKSHIRNLGSS